VLQELHRVAGVTLCCRSHAALQPHCVECRSRTVLKEPHCVAGSKMAFPPSCDLVLMIVTMAIIPMLTLGMQEDQSRGCC